VLSYHIDRQAGIVTVTGPEPSYLEYEVHLRSLLSDPRYRPGYGILRDRRDLPAPPPDSLRRMIDALRGLADIPSGRIALLVPPGDPSYYRMTRLFQVLRSGVALEVGVFFELHEARQWLSEANVLTADGVRVREAPRVSDRPAHGENDASLR
jgi:hypothetical protein